MGLSLRVKRDERVGVMVGWGGCECDGLVSNTLSLSMSATSTHPSMVSHSPVCFKAIVLQPLQSVCWCCCVVPLLPIVQSFSLTVWIWGEVIAEQPSHSCLVIHNTVCHVTPCIFLSSESWLEQCAFMKCSLCLQNEQINHSMKPSDCLKQFDGFNPSLVQHQDCLLHACFPCQLLFGTTPWLSVYLVELRILCHNKQQG